MIVLWIAAALLSALTAALVLHRASRRAGSPAADPTVDIYRRQLAEIDDLADRGLLRESERSAARAEAGRRLLTAADQSKANGVQSAPPGAMRRWVMLGAVAAPLGALGLYLALGSPGLPDQPFAQRLATWRSAPNPADLSPGELTAVMQDAVDRRPNDPQGRLLLARVQVAAGNLDAAVQNLKTAVRLAPGQAELWEALGETLVQQAQGQEPAEAQGAFRRAVALDPSAVGPRYHLGRAKIQAGDLAGGLGDWRALAASLTEPDEQAALNAQIAATQKAGRLAEPAAQDEAAQDGAAGAQAEAASPGPGPSGSQVQAAAAAQAGATPSDRRAFIQSMVESLAAKLKADPQDWRSWALLVRSYGVLGDKEKQTAAYGEAAKRFGANGDAMKALDDARAAPPAKP
ncbi:MAG TPA: c-type cytochrome biogenesis protein CcmI [Caulobacteraceae bacterium]|nr:c-type cytochrome biogenesis protein CcmI [Caulobacteraceae bacterium]